MSHEHVYELVVEKDEISWKSMLMDLIRSEEMNPWDVDITLLADKYLERIKQMKESDLAIGGKILLAASLLLRVKSVRLVGDDLDEFDRLLAGPMTQDAFYDELEQELAEGEERALKEENYELNPKLPQARRRKVSVYDLVRALEKALEVKQRRVLRREPAEIPMPKRIFDVTQAIGSLYGRITNYFRGSKDQLTFQKLLPSNEKLDKVYTFIPLLHLSNEAKVVLEQPEQFGDIHISLGEGKHADE